VSPEEPAAGHPVTASVLFTDARDRVLIVRPARPDAPWALPGGLVEADESPLDAARREVREELGIEVDLRPHDLLVVEWLEPTRPGRRARLAFLFAGPGPTRLQTRHIALQYSELDLWTWATREAALKVLHPRVADRIRGPLGFPASTLYREARNEGTPVT
jgi:ADP-ribose pyrophosphatase YjhB (NUDIX family)